VWPSQDGRHTIGEAVLAEQGTTVMVVVPASGQVDPQIRAGQIQVEVYTEGSDSPQGIEVLDQGQPTEVGGLTITSVRPRQFTGLTVVRDPGANIVWLGSIGLVLGMFMVFFFPHRRIWVRIRPTEGGSQVNLAALLRKDLTFEARFRQVTTDVALAEARRGAANE
jgi:cytochrome c biogenesis protein